MIDNYQLDATARAVLEPGLRSDVPAVRLIHPLGGHATAPAMHHVRFSIDPLCSVCTVGPVLKRRHRVVWPRSRNHERTPW